MSSAAPAIHTLADLLHRLGDVSPDRVRFRPPPGTARVQDVIDLRERESRLCELVDGVLLEKVVGYNESGLAIFLAGLLNSFVVPRNLGLVSGPDGTFELTTGLVRIPDIAFTSWDRLPGRRRPTSPVPAIAPDLAVEVLSRGNTPSEMAVKRGDYFAAGVQTVWEIDPTRRQVTVYSSPDQSVTLGVGDTLDGSPALPGFTLAVQDQFVELDRQG